MQDDFYIGWEPKAAPRFGRRMRKTTLVFLLLSAAMAVFLAASQCTIGVSAFEWGTTKRLSGTLRATPYPHLLVDRPGDPNGLPSVSTYYLVAPWKFGLSSAQTAAWDGQRVSLSGTLIYRGNQTMIEVLPETIQAEPSASVDPLPTITPLGKQTLVGEIVDSKCFFGVMNPGQLTPHRACAIRCISGGIPPVLLVRQKDGSAKYVLLVSADGQPVNQKVLNWVAEPVEITGELQRQGELLILRAEPSTYRRVQ